MIKSTTLSAIVVLACSSVTFAQTGSAPGSQPTTKEMKPGTVMVTGCVAEGSMPGKFMLTNAMMAEPMAKDGMTAPAKPAGEPHAGMAMSYALEGGENLKAHLGHKITVTGMVDKMGSMSADKPGMTKPMPEGTAGAAKDMKTGTLKVDAVKMVSATCP